MSVQYLSRQYSLVSHGRSCWMFTSHCFIVRSFAVTESACFVYFRASLSLIGQRYYFLRGSSSCLLLLHINVHLMIDFPRWNTITPDETGFDSSRTYPNDSLITAFGFRSNNAAPVCPIFTATFHCINFVPLLCYVVESDAQVWIFKRSIMEPVHLIGEPEVR